MTRILAAFLACGSAAVAAQSPSSAPAMMEPVALLHSLNARIHPVPVSSVTFSNGFWSVRNRIVFDRALLSLRQQLDDHGAIDNFLRTAGTKNIPRKGRPSSDADVYRWIESAAWAIAYPATTPTARQQLEGQVAALIPIISAAQDSNGYLDTNFTGDRAHLRFGDLVHSHEDYCLARLLLAGIAWYRVTQHRDLLTVGERFAEYLVNNFGSSTKPFVAAHPVLASAMVELYRTTGESKYLDFARYLLSGADRERLHLKEAEVNYLFSGKPLTSRAEFDGDAVNALQAASAATDYFSESGDPAYLKALNSLWSDLVTRRLTVTGAVGVRPGTVVFADPYDISGARSNADAAIAVANTWWSFRMLALTGDPKYADVLERALYNAVAEAISLNGGVGCGRGYTAASSEKIRSGYYETEYCPPDVISLIPALGSLFYSTGPDGVYVNLFDSSELAWQLEDGTTLRLVQTSSLPWNGDVKLTLYPGKAAQFSLHVRWPGWAKTANIYLNGLHLDGDFQPDSYITINRLWHTGDTVTIDFPAPPTVIRANPRAGELYGKAAVERGPIVFALQQSDQGSTPVSDLFLRVGASGAVDFRRDLFDGITVLRYPGYAADKSLGSQPLYAPWQDSFIQDRRPVQLTLFPFFTVGSRENENGEVWIPVVKPPDAPRSGLPNER